MNESPSPVEPHQKSLPPLVLSSSRRSFTISGGWRFSFTVAAARLRARQLAIFERWRVSETWPLALLI
ncbi:hypothetical protein, partial [Paraburkholderia sp. SIMBA_027]|uniref:hypothetical protein n=1 Tax=Paraburkholderia sp. SIMBA_027 TaxID=3085770 RepID=UPI00397A7890